MSSIDKEMKYVTLVDGKFNENEWQGFLEFQTLKYLSGMTNLLLEKIIRNA